MSGNPAWRVNRPAAIGLCHFETGIGDCALAWSDAGVVAIQLPEPDVASTLERLLRGLPMQQTVSELLAARPPQTALDAMHGTQALLRGEALGLTDIELDMRGVPEFAIRVYALTRAIAPGDTRTYGELARELGDVNLSRAVGQALGGNPFAPVIPCHRVLAAGDRSGGFSSHGGAEQKLRMLAIEGACPGGTLPLF
ncbi:methylated-DNA--[protein]-cysteine S-methyltransferase [Diaphorobacter aerolatus]|uniref:methylated-DNA--[protein]-cysteine S-methyltransferase n=1 Tax=Diaphorobacter aerolatus TaxID=1288495 RepID=UPI001D026543|nr:methylated-DNA--[protein]-cysteine S-methyltransferase [Diaphorobacter aerolatus]